MTRRRSSALSIPPWFDCGAFGGRGRGCCGNLSIPPWFDCGASVAWNLYPSTCLSIPPWFDCGTAALPVAGAVLAPFNPTLVRLRHRYLQGLQPGRLVPFNPTLVRLRPTLCLASAGCIAAFQSHLGSIAACRCEGISYGPGRLSIPPWFDCGRG